MQKRVLCAAIASAMVLPSSAGAVKYKLSGQVSRAVAYYDDGQQSDVRHVDNQASGTRFRLRGSEDLGNGMKAGFYWELQTSSSPSSAAFPGQEGDGAQNTNNLRQANVWFSGSWGKLTIGQQDGAGNDTTEVDLSAMDLSGVYSARTSFTGGVAWRTSTGGTIAGGLTAGQTSSNFDAFSRYDGVRYDSPALGPATLSASIGNDDKWEAAARLNTSIAGGQLAGAVFYGENGQTATPAGGVDSRYGGSLSYLFSQGTNVTVAYAESEPVAQGAPDQSNWYVKLGHKWGPHAVGVAYGETDDLGLVGNEDSGFGVGYVFSMPKVNTQLYASWMHQELDVSAATRATLAGGVEDIDVFVVGARVQFD